ncbi:MAG TPA: TetR family transcriptional regulator [Thermomicrobiales bacterium]|nr:TetR family transcriptional regulator [Thermomicrobiales bacterium]
MATTAETDGISAGTEVGGGGVRKRDASATRQALLEAANELFGTKGYDHTSLREIGERAGVDAALIARYFGGKVQLYSAALRADAETTEGTEDRSTPELILRRLIRRADNHGLGPIIRALVAAEVDPDLRQTAREHISQRLLEPLTERIAGLGVPDPELRAELIVAAIVGVITIRASGAFPTIAVADPDEIVAVIGPMLEGIATAAPGDRV